MSASPSGRSSRAARIDFDLPLNGWGPRPHQIRLWQHLEPGGPHARLDHLTRSLVNRAFPPFCLFAQT